MAEFAEVVGKWGEMCRSMNGACSRCRVNRNICDLLVCEYTPEVAQEAEKNILEWDEKEQADKKITTWGDFFVKLGFLEEDAQEIMLLEGDVYRHAVGYRVVLEKLIEDIPEDVLEAFERLLNE